MKINVERIYSRQHYAYAVYIRTLVFVQEQNCPAKSDFDCFEEEASHFLGWLDGEPVGTARFRTLEGKTAKIERIAVLKGYRKLGVGRALIKHIENIVKKMPNITKIVMSAQDHALPLYTKLGYCVIGNGYMEEGIPHHKIELNVQ